MSDNKDTISSGIFRMAMRDITDVHRISEECFPSPWSLNAIQDELLNDMAYYLVLRGETSVKGFAGSWLVFDECQITNIAVEENSRRQGVAESLLNKLKEDMIKKDMSVIFLEVRESNTPARKFYEKMGFQYTGKRKGFYQDGEDACLMSLFLKED